MGRLEPAGCSASDRGGRLPYPAGSQAAPFGRVPVPRLEQRGRPGGALAMIGIAAAVPISASRSAYGRAALERIGRNRATYSFSGGILVNPPAATDPPILMR